MNKWNRMQKRKIVKWMSKKMKLINRSVRKMKYFKRIRTKFMQKVTRRRFKIKKILLNDS